MIAFATIEPDKNQGSIEHRPQKRLCVLYEVKTTLFHDLSSLTPMTFTP